MFPCGSGISSASSAGLVRRSIPPAEEVPWPRFVQNTRTAGTATPTPYSYRARGGNSNIAPEEGGGSTSNSDSFPEDEECDPASVDFCLGPREMPGKLPACPVTKRRPFL